MTRLASTNSDPSPGPRHVVRLLDDFAIEGPNGTHACLVFELLGLTIPKTIDGHFPNGRLPGKLAKTVAKQALDGLDYLHQHGIGHGDIHTWNLAFTAPSVDNESEQEFIDISGKLEIGNVRARDGGDLEPGVPYYIVRPASYRSRSWLSSASVKIVDFGQAFLHTEIPSTLHTPLPVRAPEVVFGERLDYRVDLWSMGCMLFELSVGQPPFDSFLLTPRILVHQRQDLASDALPERWRNAWRTMELDGKSEWLGEMYFDGERNEDMTRENMVQLGRIIAKLLRFEPAARASARDILDDPWFRCDPDC
ncbi:hypothetical protein BDW74DRAFT_190048 [Aspergillus multicolor]|uniref:uncharacterized protein n=1 Tax=Aspergillus multicolor TaxID=41759 RepID=UPI003CCDC7DF